MDERKNVLRTAHLSADLTGRTHCLFLNNGVWMCRPLAEHEGTCVVIEPSNRAMPGWRTIAMSEILGDRHYGEISQDDVEGMVAGR